MLLFIMFMKLLTALESRLCVGSSNTIKPKLGESIFEKAIFVPIHDNIFSPPDAYPTIFFQSPLNSFNCKK